MCLRFCVLLNERKRMSTEERMRKHAGMFPMGLALIISEQEIGRIRGFDEELPPQRRGLPDRNEEDGERESGYTY